LEKKKKKTQSSSSDLFYPPRTKVCTQTFSRFLTDYHLNLDSFFFIVSLVAKSDKDRVRAAGALAGVSEGEEKKKYERSAADADLAMREFKKYSAVQSRNLTNAAVSGFQRYSSEIIQAVVLKRPEILRSGQNIRIEDVLRFNRHKDIVSYLIDKKINELSYGGIQDIEAYFRDRLNIEMFNSERERTLLTVFIEIRNINVHNRGIVNDLFLSKVGLVEGFRFERGKTFQVDLDELIKLSDNAIGVALNLDRAVSNKFKLKRKSHAAWTINNVQLS